MDIRRALAIALAIAAMNVAFAQTLREPDADRTRDRARAAQIRPPAINPSGMAATVSSAGRIDSRNPFFQSLGTNGRSCASCHVESEGWTITPRGVQARFRATAGNDPVFRPNDGANSPRADVSTPTARRKAYSMLLRKGLIRVGLPIPADAEFTLAKVDDPYRFASANELSLFRRPMPSVNVRFLSTIMWDGRETTQDPASRDCLYGTTTCFSPLHFDLAHQSNAATEGHAQATRPLSDSQRQAIVSFQMGLFNAQVYDRDAGSLTADGAKGGPAFLQRQPSYFGINDTLVGDYRTHAAFTPTAMTLFDGWAHAMPDAGRPGDLDRERERALARRAIARGQALFNSKPITITGVKGINDDLKVAALQGTCTTCHNAPNAGNHSIPMPLDIGLSDASRRTPDLPLYTLRNKATGETIETTDPGRALVSGRWKDIGRFKGPILRGLAARPPYFHNGAAKDLGEVVDFYDERFGIGFTAQEREDLQAFLRAL